MQDLDARKGGHATRPHGQSWYAPEDLHGGDGCSAIRTGRGAVGRDLVSFTPNRGRALIPFGGWGRGTNSYSGGMRMRVPGRTLLFSLVTLASLLGGAASPAVVAGAQPAPQQAQLTWMSIANWLIEVGNTRLVVNGYISRIQESDFTARARRG